MLLLALSKKVVLQKRIVYDISTMLGDVGGLYDFIVLVTSTVIGFFSEKLMFAKLIG